MIAEQDNIKNFRDTVCKITEVSVDRLEFTGIGLILYNPEKIDPKIHTSLRPSVSLPYPVNLSEIDKTTDLLLMLSDKSNTLHDGFHFFNGVTGNLDCPAEYFVPPIVKELKVNEKYGTRYHSALYGSCVNGVLLTGTVNNDNNGYIFKKGFEIENIKVKLHGKQI